MSTLASLHGEIAGLHSGSYPPAEGWQTYTRVEALNAADYGWSPRQDVNGNGGEYVFGRASSIVADGVVVFNESNGIVGKTAEEFFIRIPLHKTDSNDYLRFDFQSSADSGYDHVRIELTTAGAVQIHAGGTGTNPALAESLAGVIPDAPGDWPVLNVWIRIDPSNGFVRIYKDFDFAGGPILEHTGDTFAHLGSPAQNVDEVAILFGYDCAIDDVRFQDITMSYESGSGGTISVGDTITGNNSSSTAVVTRVDGDDTSGVLQLREVSDWSSGLQEDDPFAAASDTTISNGSGWSATLSNGGLDPSSGHVPNGYTAAALVPNGEGNVTNLDSSPVQADADQWENAVYDGVGGSTVLGIGPDAEVAYNYDSTGGNGDLYTATDIAIDTADINAIRFVRVYGWCRKDGSGVDNVQMQVRHGTTTGQGPSQALSASYDVFSAEFTTNPDTGVAWVDTELDDIEIGAEFG